MKPYKLGLALGSGGWRGLAHIGVIKSLLKHNFEISAIAGSSSGALIGGAFAATQNINLVQDFFSQLNYKDLLFAFADPSSKLGFIGGNNTLKLIKKYIGDIKIESLKIPFAAVASDVLSGKPVVIKSGDLAAAIRASSSVPLVFEPVRFNHHLLIDGGVINPIPVKPVRRLGADIVIGVDIYRSMFTTPIADQKISKIDLINLSYHLMLSQLAAQDLKTADLQITPDIKNLAYDPFSKFIDNQQTIDSGEQAMDQAIDQLTQLIEQLP